MDEDSEIFQAFVAGFMVSGEGYNAEYTFDNDPETAAHELLPEFEDWRGNNE